MKVYEVEKHPTNGLYYITAFDSETGESLPVQAKMFLEVEQDENENNG